MQKTSSPGRKQRRAYENWLKKNNPIAYNEWKSQNQLRGKSLSDEQAERVRDAETQRLETIQGELINKLKDEGKSQDEIDRYLSIWVNTIKPWGSDEKPLSWKEAEKEYDLENSNNTSSDNDTTN